MLASSSAESAEVAALEEEMATELAREVGNRGKGEAQGSPELDEGPAITPTPSRRADIDRYTFHTFTSHTIYQRGHTDQHSSCGMCLFSPHETTFHVFCILWESFVAMQHFPRASFKQLNYFVCTCLLLVSCFRQHVLRTLIIRQGHFCGELNHAHHANASDVVKAQLVPDRT